MGGSRRPSGGRQEARHRGHQHQEGGGPFEPMDLPASTRHLDLYRAQITMLDKNWQTQTLGRARTMRCAASAFTTRRS